MVIEIDRYALLERASQGKGKDLPPADQLVETLLEIEREARKTKEIVSFDRLLGTWRLQFITGTKKARGGIVLGAGRYLPRWLTISLTYHRSGAPESPAEMGTIANQVQLGALQFTLSGPAKIFPKRRILAFDFTRMTVTLFGATLYSGYIRGGEASEATFFSDTIQKQAFFAYFLLTERAISARGRGGGLALWVRD